VPERVIVAMSGGVDSSLAAARLRDAGYEVVGVTLHLWDYPERSERGRCCAPEDQYDARRVADVLGIPHYTFDRRELFAREVVAPFVDAYLEGRTPSPCVACNRTVKLRELLPLADRLGARYVATGHYARITRAPSGRAELRRGRDRGKDQSYFLHMLDEAELARVLLPLGESTKEEVRAEAQDRRLPGAGKGESQELCFVADGRYDAFVADRAPDRVRPGPIVDRDGRIVGRHTGVHRFTVGQRKGIGVALGKPAFVVGVDAESGAVKLGSEDDLLAGGAELGDDLVLASDVSLPLRASVQVRARHAGAMATLAREPGPLGERLVVRFDEPVRAVSPGQVAVAFLEDGALGDRVLGGATIVRALRARAPGEDADLAERADDALASPSATEASP
jgi:tRNA-specific 2-thiouridylase